MIEQFTRQVAENVVAEQDRIFEQFLVKNGLLTNADRKPIDVNAMKKRLRESGYKILETKETIGGKTTFKLELVKIVDTLKYSMEFKIDGVNFK